MKTALITGITGQDGSYLAEFLLDKGYEVHGMVRRSSMINTHRIDHIYRKIHLHYGDMTDTISILSIIGKVRPDEIYNLAAQSHVKVSFELPEYTGMVDALGTMKILEAIQIEGLENECRFYQASTSELFGEVWETPQTERTPFNPRSPYAIAKQYAFNMTKMYREAYGFHASSGILFNHESPRRGETFVTKKIVMGLNKIAKGEEQYLYLGNLDAKRDWGHARDYVEAMWMMLQKDHPDDYVIATGKQHSVRDFVTLAGTYFDMEIRWIGEGENEVGYIPGIDRIVVRVDKKYYRPLEVETLLGDSTKARKVLGWTPKTSFDELVKEMCEYEQGR